MQAPLGSQDPGTLGSPLTHQILVGKYMMFMDLKVRLSSLVINPILLRLPYLFLLALVMFILASKQDRGVVGEPDRERCSRTTLET